MKEPSKEPVRVTDHAVIRYLERAMGLNIEIVREHIASLCTAPAAFGATALRAEGVKFEIVNGTVISVVPDTGTSLSRSTQERASRALQRGKEQYGAA